LNDLSIVIQSRHRKAKLYTAVRFSENPANCAILIFYISFLFLKIVIRSASQNSLQDCKLITRTKLFAFLTSHL